MKSAVDVLYENSLEREREYEDNLDFYSIPSTYSSMEGSACGSAVFKGVQVSVCMPFSSPLILVLPHSVQLAVNTSFTVRYGCGKLIIFNNFI